MPPNRKSLQGALNDIQLKYLNGLKSSFSKASAIRRHKMKQEAYNFLKRASGVQLSQEDKEDLKKVCL
jgi:hypothetical protein